VPLWTIVLHHVATPLRTLEPLGGVRVGFAGLPAAVQVVLVVAFADLCAYWGHRAQHHFAPLWRFHAVHHTSEHLDWLAAYREHPLDGLYTQLLVNAPAILLGVDLRAWLGVVVFRGAWATFVHSAVRVPLGPLKWIFGAPEFHRAHHAPDVSVGHFANLAPWLDVLFGTHGPVGEPPRFGIDEVHPRGWLSLLAWSFRMPGWRRAPAHHPSAVAAR
jgi:sterol desaturase/sphingolipid hydroxylase (fatty acid hydroxylase superfamily)